MSTATLAPTPAPPNADVTRAATRDLRTFDLDTQELICAGHADARRLAAWHAVTAELCLRLGGLVRDGVD